MAGLSEDAASFVTGVPVLWSALRWLDHYLPVTDGFVVLGLVVVLYGAALAFEAVVWVLTKLHLLGGGST